MTAWFVVTVKTLNAEFFLLLVFTEGTEGQADGDGEDRVRSRERHQQTPTQHSDYRGKQTHRLSNVKRTHCVCVTHGCHNTSLLSSYISLEKPPV